MRSAIASGSPDIPSTLSRAPAPRAISNVDLGRCHSRANKSITALLALPSSGGAVTEARSAPATGSSVARRALGCTRNSMVTPFATRRRKAGSEDDTLEPDDILPNEMLHEDDQQEGDHRRNVDAAQIGQQAADRPQHRLGDAVEEVDHHADELVAHVDDAERHQPTQDRACDDDPRIDVEDLVDKKRQRDHRLSAVLKMPAARPAGHPTRRRLAITSLFTAADSGPRQGQIDVAQPDRTGGADVARTVLGQEPRAINVSLATAEIFKAKPAARAQQPGMRLADRRVGHRELARLCGLR